MFPIISVMRKEITSLNDSILCCNSFRHCFVTCSFPHTKCNNQIIMQSGLQEEFIKVVSDVDMHIL